MKTGEKFLIYPQFMRMEKPAGKVYRPMERPRQQLVTLLRH